MGVCRAAAITIHLILRLRFRFLFFAAMALLGLDLRRAQPTVNLVQVNFLCLMDLSGGSFSGGVLLHYCDL